MNKQAERMQGLTAAIFSQVADLQQQAIAAGKDVIQLSIGSPDLSPAPHIVEALKKAADCEDNYGYTLSKGKPELLSAIADWYLQKFDVKLDANQEVLSLLGSQDGLAHLSLCLVNPGDTVLVPDPGYPIFSTGPMIAGATLHAMPLLPANHYLPDLAAIPEDVLRKTKLMILNYPNNPLAATAPREFFVEVVGLAKKYDFVVCHDFAYSELVFDGYRPESFLSIPGARDIGVEINSLSKTYNMCGCRVGYIVGNSEVLSLLERLKSNFDYGIFAPLQAAAIAALTGPQDCVREMAATYQRRRDIIVDGFTRMGWPVERPKASMYIWAKVPTDQTSLAFTMDLLSHTGVVVIPGNAFGSWGEGFIRIALVQSEQRLEQAVERIAEWLGKI